MNQKIPTILPTPPTPPTPQIQAARSPSPIPSKPRRRVWADLDERAITFSPLAWLKLRLFLHAGDVEVGGFGLAAQHDLLFVEVRYSVPRQAAFDPVTVKAYLDEVVLVHKGQEVTRHHHFPRR